MTHPTCCICSPEIPMNPHLCPEHKAEAREYAEKYNTYFSQAAGELYLEAKEPKSIVVRCSSCGCTPESFNDLGQAILCDGCLAGCNGQGLHGMTIPRYQQAV